jgi:hypothetical protein
MIRLLTLILAATLVFPHAGQAFDEIDQIGSNNFKPILVCSNCHLRHVSSSGRLRWIGALLPKAKLKKANLRNADMRGANLQAADLRQADLREANFAGGNLRNANLNGTDLRGANLFKTDLTGVKLRSAKLCKTTMPNGSMDNTGCGSPHPSIEPRPIQSAEAKKTQSGKSFRFLGFWINLPARAHR